MIRLRIIPIVCSLIFALCACSSETEIANEAPVPNEVAAGSKFKIVLPEDHTQGDSWLLKDDFDQNMVDHINTVWHGNEKGVFFHFSARRGGQTTLTFVKRHFNDTVNVKSFSIKIIGN